MALRTPAEHYYLAERLLQQAKQEPHVTQANTIAAALAHATLAQASPAIYVDASIYEERDNKSVKGVR